MPRVELPFIGQSYESRQKKLSAQRAVNLYPEVNPETRNMVSMNSRPGLLLHASVDPGPDRGIYRFNETLYAIVGETLYTVGADGATTSIGTVPGSGRCVMADNGTYLLIATGGTPYIHTFGSLSVTAVTDPDIYSPTWFAYLNSQFIFDQNQGTLGQWGTSDPSVATFSVSALDVATAEAHPDDVIRGLVFNQYLYLFGQRSFETWYNSGTGNPPFARVQGGVRPIGIAGTHAGCVTSEAIYFLDHNRIPRRGTGLEMQNIGNPALGAEFLTYNKISDCVVSSWVIDHQRFVQFTFPSVDKCWCFHEPSGSWFQMAYGYDETIHRGAQVAEAYGLNYTVDYENGKVYELDICQKSDDGEEMRRSRITGPIHGGLFGAPGQKLFFDTVELIIGRGPCVSEGLGKGQEPVPGGNPCVTAAELTTGAPLGPTPTQLSPIGEQYALSTGEISQRGLTLEDSKYLCLTFGFARAADVDLTAGEQANLGRAALSLIDLTGANSTGFDPIVDVRLTTAGHIEVAAQNSSQTDVLLLRVTNNGGSWCDGSFHLFALQVDLSDATARSLYVDNVDLTSNSSYTNWITYTDDNIDYSDLSQAAVGMTITMSSGPYAFGATAYGGAGNTAGTDSIGFISFDNACSLLPSALWNDSGWVMDPQGDGSGWYASRPKFLFISSLFKNAGSWGHSFEAWMGDEYDSTDTFTGGDDVLNQTSACIVNNGIGGTIS